MVPLNGGCRGDGRGRGGSNYFGMELAAMGNPPSDEMREGRAERYSDERHLDCFLSPIVLRQPLAGVTLASGNVSATFEPVLGSEILSFQQRVLNPVTEAEVGNGSGLLSFQQSDSPTTRVEGKLRAPF